MSNSRPIQKPLCLKWSKLTFSVDQQSSRSFSNLFKSSRSRPKVILQPQSGHVSAGELLAIIGPSGAGKSTFLNCLTGRYSNTSGQIGLVSCVAPPRVTVAFVPQSDALFPQFTVFETLLFASKLKNDPSSDHKSLVHQLIDDFDLARVSNTKCGKLSGGQTKRVAICTEVISHPTILVLDEPTTGLDSSAAAHCVSLLRDLATNRHLAVICSIHQPNNDVFVQFSKTYLLSNSGHLIFFDKPTKLIDYFATSGLECPKNRNIAEFAIDVARGAYKGVQLEVLADKCSAIGDCDLDIDEIDNQRLIPLKKLVNSSKNQQRASIFGQIGLISRRNVILWNVRTPLLIARIAINTIIVSLFLNLFEQPPGLEDGCIESVNVDGLSASDVRQVFTQKLDSIRNVSVTLFVYLFYILALSLTPSMLIYPIEYRVIRTELANNWYSSSSYLVAKTLSDLPIVLVHQGLAYTHVYVLGHFLPEWDRALIYFAATVATYLIAECWGNLFATFYVNDMLKGIYLGTMSMVPLVVMSGFFIPYRKLNMWLKPVATLSFVRYAFEIGIAAQYGRDRCPSSNLTTKVDLYAELALAYSPFRAAFSSLDKITSNSNGSQLATAIDVNPKYVTEFLTSIKNKLNETLESSGSGTIGDQLYSSSYVIQHFEVSDDDIGGHFLSLLVTFCVIKLITYVTLRYRNVKL